ncbi:MAG TPA: ABC transporter ATP-binding protein [Chitinophagaceae bacterium]|nr:ABC transporter ATP-binding protein [Chitinophagaceae bacterium]
MTAILRVNGLRKQFKTVLAVDDLNFQIEKGDICGFLGPNGSGKSTTLRMLLGFIKPDAGTITFFGDDQQYKPQPERIGSMIEKPDFYGYLSAYDNLNLFARASGIQKADDIITRLLKRVGLDRRAQHKVKTYSQGMKQRLGLAQALLHDPELIILDEPNTGLDPQGIIDLRNLILDLNKTEGKTILFSSHVLSEVQELCNRIVVIHQGRALIEGEVSELLSTENLWVTLQVQQAEKAETFFTQNTKYPFEKRGVSFQLKMAQHEIPALIQELTREGIDIFRIDYRNQLEEYFLKITARG